MAASAIVGRDDAAIILDSEALVLGSLWVGLHGVEGVVHGIIHGQDRDGVVLVQGGVILLQDVIPLVDQGVVHVHHGLVIVFLEKLVALAVVPTT